MDVRLTVVLRNTPRLVLTNWPLMENVFGEPDSCQEHLRSCFTVIKSKWPLRSTCISTSALLSSFFFHFWSLVKTEQLIKVATTSSGRQTETSPPPKKMTLKMKDYILFHPLAPLFQRKQKQKRLGCDVPPAVLGSSSLSVLHF